MARNIQDFDGQKHLPDSDYLSGDIKDDTGALDGTDANRKSNADIHQFFVKFMSIVGIVTNGLPDNEYNGYQFVRAVMDAVGNHRRLFIKDGVAATDVVDADSSTIVLVRPTAQASHIVSMNIPSGTYKAPITIYNYSAFSVDVYDALGTKTINGSSSPFTLPALTAVKFTYNGSTNWAMDEKYVLDA